MASEDGGSKNSAKRTIFDTARDVAFVAAIYLFFAGFLYQYFWYQSLGIPFSPSEFEINSLLVFAYYAFADNFTSVIIAAAVAAVAAGAWIIIATRMKLSAHVLSLGGRSLTAVACIAMFPLLYAWAQSATYQAINKPLEGHAYTLVHFDLKETAVVKGDSEFIAANGRTLTLLTASDQFFYALQIPLGPRACGTIPHTAVFAIRKDDVVRMRTLIPPRTMGASIDAKPPTSNC